MPLFAVFIAQSLCQTTENNTAITEVNDTNTATATTTTNTTTTAENNDMNEAETTKNHATTKSPSSSTLTSTIPTTTTKTPQTNPSTASQTSPKDPHKTISKLVTNSTFKTSTAAVTCNKTTSLLSERQKFTTLMVFFGLPIGLLLVLVGTLSVALLLVTRKRMKLKKGMYLSEPIPFVEIVKDYGV